MDRVKIMILVILFLLIVSLFKFKKNRLPEKPVHRNPWEELRKDKEEIIEEPKPKVEEKPDRIDPEFIEWSPVKSARSSLGVVLGDIESHMPDGHAYSDSNKITWGHETTHGINANIRNKYYKSERVVNAFYCLNNKACLVEEPKLKLSVIAGKIPEILRGPSYKLYLIDQVSGWNDRPLYLLDEWTAYTNGSEVGKELSASGFWYELLQAHNFNIYCMYLAREIKNKQPDYDDTQLKRYMMWNIERVFRLTEDNVIKAIYFEKSSIEQNWYFKDGFFHKHLILEYGDDSDRTMNYLELVRSSPEGEDIRLFAREYFGNEWCKRVYGF